MCVCVVPKRPKISLFANAACLEHVRLSEGLSFVCIHVSLHVHCVYVV